LQGGIQPQTGVGRRPGERPNKAKGLAVTTRPFGFSHNPPQSQFAEMRRNRPLRYFFFLAFFLAFFFVFFLAFFFVFFLAFFFAFFFNTFIHISYRPRVCEFLIEIFVVSVLQKLAFCLSCCS